MLAPKLKKGDTIGIVAPSKNLSSRHKTYLETFKNYMENEGLKVKYSENIFKANKYLTSAGSPKQRADDFNSMIKDEEIKAIWCFQGGETAIEIIDFIDFESLKKNPKLILGKSDCDILLLSANKSTGLITFHSPDPKIGRDDEMDLEYNKKWFKKRLFEGSKEIEETKKRITIRKGKCEGKLMGCNMPSILRLAGTKYFPDFDGSILFLKSYMFDPRMLISQLTQLKMLGVLDKINGMVIGHHFGFSPGEGGANPEEIIADLTSKFDFPILKIYEFGDYIPNAFLPIGAKIKMDADEKTVVVVEDFVQ